MRKHIKVKQLWYPVRQTGSWTIESHNSLSWKNHWYWSKTSFGWFYSSRKF